MEEARTIEQRLDELERKIDHLIHICSRMDGHITFVENAYDKFNHPLNVIKEKVEGIFGKKAIKDKENET